MTFPKTVLVLLSVLILNLGVVFPQDNSLAVDSLQQPPRENTGIQSRIDLYESITRNVNLFGTLYREVSLNYVDQINPETFIRAGIDGMLNSLDPYTEYYEEEETEELDIMTRGKYGGIGIQIGLRGSDRSLTVIAPIEGTPGWRIGLRPGDQIIEIDGESTKGFTTSDAAKRMRGTPGDTVRIKVQRFGLEEPLDFAIKREIIKVQLISYAGMIEPGIGFIRLTRFDRTAGKQVRDAIEKLKSEGLEALILDLRGNPGGLLPEAVSVAENFLKKGDLIVSTKGRVKSSIREFRSENDPSISTDIPLVVLTNQGSASASEIVAGAIQDHDRGVIVGMPSFGKGLVQSVINFSPGKRMRGKPGSALKITTAKYYTPSGRLIQKTDYFNENESLIGHAVEPEETDTLFFTDSGRHVAAHGGIQPDFEIKLDNIGIATLELWRQGEFFEFTGKYYGLHPDLKDYTITDEIYQEFLQFLKESDFTFETDAQKLLEKVRENAEKAEYGDDFFKELEELEAVAEQEREELISAEETDIRHRLRLELAVIVGGSTARVEATFDFDPQLQKSLELLRENDAYYAALTPGEESEK